MVNNFDSNVQIGLAVYVSGGLFVTTILTFNIWNIIKRIFEGIGNIIENIKAVDEEIKTINRSTRILEGKVKSISCVVRLANPEYTEICDRDVL